jgi:hypothetical protein
MGQDIEEAAKGVLSDRMDAEIEDFLAWHEAGGPMSRTRGVRRGGERTEVWMSDRL